MHEERLESGPQDLLNRCLNAMASGFLLLFVFQIILGVFTKSYVDDTSNYFLSREYFERLTPLVSLIGVISGCSISTHTKSQLAFFPTVFAFCFVSAAIVSRHYLGFASISNPWTNDFFGGFGVKVLSFAILLSATWVIRETWSLENFPNEVFRKLSILISTLLVVVFYLPASIVTSQSIFHSDFVYVLNELLGPRADHAPLVSAVPQYSSLLGWPLKLVSLLPTSIFIEVSVIYVSLLFGVIVFVIVKIIRELFPRLPLIYLIFVAVSILLARPSGRTSGSFIMFPSAIVRNVLPMLTILLFFICMKRRSITYSVILGLSVVLTALNNLEFGLISAIAVTLSLFYGLIFRKVSVSLVATYFSALVIGSLALGFILNLNVHSWWRYKFFATAFGGGNNNIPMPIFGLHSLTMVISALAVVVGAYDLRSIRREDQFREVETRSFMLLASGLAACGFHLYYTGRSMVSTQLQTEFPILIICSALLINRLRIFSVTNRQRNQVLSKLPFLLIAFLPLGCLFLAPDPTIEMSRIQGRLPESEYGSFKLGFTQINQSEFSRFLDQARTEFNDSSIGIIADHNGNALSLIHKMPNLLPFNAMNDITDITTESQTAVCDSIEKSNVEYLALEKEDNSSEGQMFVRACNSLEKLPVLESPFGVLLKLKVPNL